MTAANRVGILSAVTNAMADLGGDLREASQTVVRGFFTMIFSAEFPDTLEPEIIKDHLADACRPFGIDVGLKDPSAERLQDAAVSGSQLHTLRLGGLNQPGVLRQLSSVISMNRVDIAGMRAIRTRSGEGFEMVIKLSTPPDYDLTGLLKQLHETGKPFEMTADLMNG